MPTRGPAIPPLPPGSNAAVTPPPPALPAAVSAARLTPRGSPPPIASPPLSHPGPASLRPSAAVLAPSSDHCSRSCPTSFRREDPAPHPLQPRVQRRHARCRRLFKARPLGRDNPLRAHRLGQ